MQSSPTSPTSPPSSVAVDRDNDHKIDVVCVHNGGRCQTFLIDPKQNTYSIICVGGENSVFMRVYSGLQQCIMRLTLYLKMYSMRSSSEWKKVMAWKMFTEWTVQCCIRLSIMTLPYVHSIWTFAPIIMLRSPPRPNIITVAPALDLPIKIKRWTQNRSGKMKRSKKMRARQSSMHAEPETYERNTCYFCILSSLHSTHNFPCKTIHNNQEQKIHYIIIIVSVLLFHFISSVYFASFFKYFLLLFLLLLFVAARSGSWEYYCAMRQFCVMVAW